MKIDTNLPPVLERIGESAADLERKGFDGLWTGEVNHDPFLPLAVAAEATSEIDIGTSIAVAFARNPMVTAAAANDLARMSRGRFILGLGSQVKPHIERRFGMPWSRPAERMHEYIRALRAIWSSWEDGSPLDFRGEFYSHTLMPPAFRPEPHGFGAPRIFLAGVGERMSEVAGEVADGFICHAFSTPRYLSEVVLPALSRGWKKAATNLEDFAICVPCFVAAGRDEEELARQRDVLRGRVAFYASTPAYRGVLDLHGWGDLQPQLQELTRADRWLEMGGLIDDEVLGAFAAVGTPEEVGRELRERYSSMASRLLVDLSQIADPTVAAEVLEAAAET